MHFRTLLKQLNNTASGMSMGRLKTNSAKIPADISSQEWREKDSADSVAITKYERLLIIIVGSKKNRQEQSDDGLGNALAKQHIRGRRVR